MYEPRYPALHTQEEEVRGGTVAAKHIFGQEHCDTISVAKVTECHVEDLNTSQGRKQNQNINHTKCVSGSVFPDNI